MSKLEDVLTKTYTIHTIHGTSKFKPTEETKYYTQVGVAGELILYKVTMHKTFHAKTGDSLWKIWAPGQWTKVLAEEENDD